MCFSDYSTKQREKNVWLISADPCVGGTCDEAPRVPAWEARVCTVTDKAIEDFFRVYIHVASSKHEGELEELETVMQT